MPLPASLHDARCSKARVGIEREMLAPPTATTFADVAGQLVPGLSPLDAK
jgi:hypothetical protein